jgi:hypothetical protein
MIPAKWEQDPDRLLGLRERLARPAQRVGDRSFADRQPEQLAHQPGQPVVSDRAVMMQIGQHRLDRGAALRQAQPFDGLRSEPSGMSAGGTPRTRRRQQGQHRPKIRTRVTTGRPFDKLRRRQVDVVISLPQPLARTVQGGAGIRRCGCS